MKTKVCGITNFNDAELALNCKAWALGFNFYKNSPRSLPPAKAKEIIQALPKKIITVGIFVDQTYQEVQQIMQDLKLNLAQVYQNYDCPPEAKQSMILAIQPSTQKDLPPLDVLKQYAYILIDAPRTKPDIFGGSGKLANWDIARDLSKHFKLLLAGGLNISNLEKAINTVQPFAVDVCSSIESKPGIKNPSLLQQFLNLTSHAK